MKNLDQIKTQIGEYAENLENKITDLWTDYSPHYTNLEPYQRGLVLIGLLVLLVFAIYYLTSESTTKKKNHQSQAEAELEARLLKRMETLKRLRE